MEITGMKMIVIVVLAFVCEYMDSTLGMGYGTTLTPLFMLMGFSPMQIVPAILVSELCTGLLAGIFHHREGNVNLKPINHDYLKIYNLIHPIRFYHSVSKSFPMHLKIALLFGFSSTIGAVLAVIVAFNIPKFWLKMYIGVLVLAMGILILVFFRRKIRFSIVRITGIGLLASFNKALSGGGYGCHRRPNALRRRGQKCRGHYFCRGGHDLFCRGCTLLADPQRPYQLAARPLYCQWGRPVGAPFG